MADNPNWKPFLDVLPESLHEIVKPVLRQWDEGVTQKIQDVRAEAEHLKPYAKFAENKVDPEYLEQAAMVARMIETDPNTVVQRLNESLDLGYIPKDQVPVVDNSNDDDDDWDDDNMDIQKNPEFIAMKQALEAMQQKFDEDYSSRTEQQQLEEFQAELDRLDSETEGGIDRDIVTAYIANGMSSEDAVKRYQELVAKFVTPPNTNNEGQADNEQPPVVMGGNGAAGSGTPTEPINFGQMKQTGVMDVVENMLRAAQENSNS